MSSSEASCQFQQAEQGTHTFPCQAGSIKKGGYCMLKGRPCRVIELSTSKDSKHGYGQACITGVDIFTGQKCEESKTTTATIQVPIVTKEEYPVVALQEEEVVLLMASGSLKRDLRLPDDKDVRNAIAKAEKNGTESELKATVIGACGFERILSICSKE